jgi:hypothetical protein
MLVRNILKQSDRIFRSACLELFARLEDALAIPVHAQACLKHAQRLPEHASSSIPEISLSMLRAMGPSVLRRYSTHLKGHARKCAEHLGTFSGSPPGLDHDWSMLRRVWDIPGHARACLEHAQRTSGNILSTASQSCPSMLETCPSVLGACPGAYPRRHRVSRNIPCASSRDTPESMLGAFARVCWDNVQVIPGACPNIDWSVPRQCQGRARALLGVCSGRCLKYPPRMPKHAWLLTAYILHVYAQASLGTCSENVSRHT